MIGRVILFLVVLIFLVLSQEHMLIQLIWTKKGQKHQRSLTLEAKTFITYLWFVAPSVPSLSHSPFVKCSVEPSPARVGELDKEE